MTAGSSSLSCAPSGTERCQGLTPARVSEKGGGPVGGGAEPAEGGTGSCTAAAVHLSLPLLVDPLGAAHLGPGPAGPLPEPSLLLPAEDAQLEACPGMGV